MLDLRYGAYLLLLPLFAVLGFIEVYPLIESIILSVTSSATGGAFVGFNDYALMLTDPFFWNSVIISLVYSVGSTMLVVTLGLLFAYLLTLKVKGKGFFEAIFLMPLAVAPIVVGVLWAPSAIWDDINVFVHYVLRFPFIDVTQSAIFVPIMIVSEAWEWAPIMMLVALSVISSIPKEVYDASSVHGASELQTFRMISVPAILASPVTQFVMVIRFIDAMRAFEIPFAWSSWVGLPKAGSPTDTLSLLLFKLLSVPAYGFPTPLIAAIAVTLLALTLVGAAVLLRLMRSIGRI